MERKPGKGIPGISDRSARTGASIRAALAVACVCASVAVHAAAGVYPERPIRLMVPYPPGGGVDSAARLLAEGLSDKLGQQLVIDNRSGAGGIIGIEIVARAVPDGYTLLVGSTGLTSSPGLYAKLPFDPVRDFAPITIAVSGAYILVTHPGLPVQSVKELIAMAKASPGKLNYGSAGVGTTIHLAGEMFRSMAGIDVVHVPYKGLVAAMTDVAGGQVQMMFGALMATMPLLKAGKLRGLAVTSARRSVLAPDLPTIAEAALPGYEVSGWYGFLAPARTPAAIVSKLRDAAVSSLQNPATREKILAQGLEPVGSTPEEAAQYVKADMARWVRVIRAAGIKGN